MLGTYGCVSFTVLVGKYAISAWFLTTSFGWCPSLCRVGMYLLRRCLRVIAGFVPIWFALKAAP